MSEYTLKCLKMKENVSILTILGSNSHVFGCLNTLNLVFFDGFLSKVGVFSRRIGILGKSHFRPGKACFWVKFSYFFGNLQENFFSVFWHFFVILSQIVILAKNPDSSQKSPIFV